MKKLILSVLCLIFLIESFQKFQCFHHVKTSLVGSLVLKGSSIFSRLAFLSPFFFSNNLIGKGRVIVPVGFGNMVELLIGNLRQILLCCHIFSCGQLLSCQFLP